MNLIQISAILTLPAVLAVGLSGAEPGRSRDFNADWQFHRGDVPGAEEVGFDDSEWRTLDVPHDWSIEDLPAKEDGHELDAVTGEWRFRAGDEAAWKAADLDDSDWRAVTLPSIWEDHGQSKEDNVYGWFRRRIELPEELRGKDFVLLLGKIDDVDETFVNGQRVGGTGSFPPNYRWADEEQRRYPVPASLVEDGAITIAVRVFDGANNGGIHAAGTKSERVGPFDPDEASNRHFTAFTIGGIGWYRKSFPRPEAGKRVSVVFDGVYMNAEVWLNGHRLGEHPHGYTGFEFELTPHLRPGENVLAVKVRNEGRNSRWYSGSGIYREVTLQVTDPLHVPTWGLFVTTPEVSEERATVKVSTEVENERDEEVTAGLRVTVFDDAGKARASSKGTLTIPAGETRIDEQTLVIERPRLWSVDAPVLHRIEVEIVVGGEVVDIATASFGIRSLEADAKRGFRLNGEPLLLKGGCIHHDNGPLGAAAIERAEERKIELLKANGYNAIRSAHNPPSTALLDACDRLGMLVINEAFDQWREVKENNHQGYQRFFDEWWRTDVAAMVRRDRNHPSVIMWSIGNEIPEQYRDKQTGKALREEVLRHDTTRFVTQGLCNYANENTGSGFEPLDIGGYNYLPGDYAKDHERFPERIMYGSESFPKDTLEYWRHVEEKPYVIGDFVWTAMDYLGEAGLAHSVRNDQPNPFFMSWPWVNAWCGDLDLCGFKKPQSFYRDIVWDEREVAMFVREPMPPGMHEVLSWWGWPKENESWRGREGEKRLVAVYAGGDAVRLELNGEVVGEKPVSDATKLTAIFELPYAPGELKAIALEKGKVIGETTLSTVGEPAAIRLTADRGTIRADRGDLAYVTVEVVDAEGRRVPDAKLPLRLEVTGAGELAGHASAVPNEPASFQGPLRESYEGRCLVVLRPRGEAGTIRLKVTGDGLESGMLKVETR